MGQERLIGVGLLCENSSISSASTSGNRRNRISPPSAIKWKPCRVPPQICECWRSEIINLRWILPQSSHLPEHFIRIASPLLQVPAGTLELLANNLIITIETAQSFVIVPVSIRSIRMVIPWTTTFAPVLGLPNIDWFTADVAEALAALAVHMIAAVHKLNLSPTECGRAILKVFAWDTYRGVIHFASRWHAVASMAAINVCLATDEAVARSATLTASLNVFFADVHVVAIVR